MKSLVHVASVSASHGVRGEFKLFCLLESPESISSFKEFFDENGNKISLKLVSTKGKQPIAKIDGIEDKNASDLIRNKKIFVLESAFPTALENEFYAYQLVGLKVIDNNSQVIGMVKDLHNFGAGNVLEIDFFDGKIEFYPFTEEVFPDINMETGTIYFIEPKYI